MAKGKWKAETQLSNNVRFKVTGDWFEHLELNEKD